MDIFATTKKELHSFFNDKIHIAGTKQDGNARYLKGKETGYEFSQWQMINIVDLYYNSKFESGENDTEGQRKLFLNVCRFRADVASKQIDLDVKDFNFLPDEGAPVWPAYFLGREFKQWAKENYLGELLNTHVEKFPRYGTIVAKECHGELEDVPLQTLRVQQDAKSLDDARFVIIEHKDMCLEEIKENEKWNTKGLDLKPGETITVYERYGYVSGKDYKQVNDDESIDDETEYDCLTILTLNGGGDVASGNILFMEMIDERPFVEAHWARQHGRWMGIGEIENQLENQIGANLAFNLYRRQLLWSSKKIFQSPSDEIARNLVRDVKDGDVLKITANGNITPVDMTNRAAGDFNNFSNILDKNSDQKSFTYEVATGAALPSGTPFRLGVVMSNAVNSHFDLKREKLGLFYKRAITELIIPTFVKQFSKEKVISMFSTEDGFIALRETMKAYLINDEIKKAILDLRIPDIEMIKGTIESELNKKTTLGILIPEGFYKQAKYQVTLSITGEEIDLPKKIETLTNLYTALVQKGDPRADRILARVLSYAGENIDILAGMENVQSQPSPIQLPAQAPQSTMALPAKSSMQL